MVAELCNRKESCDNVQTKESQLWARSAGQEDVGEEEERNEVEEEEEGMRHWGGARGEVDGRWTNLPGLAPACDER